MANRLANETSPYLRQHADNPVDWYPWGEEAFAEARRRDVPILLSVGYSSCHWCHVMAHESFEHEPTAEVMNRLFVNVKVDREERPDLDAIYMDAVQAMTGNGGWPMTVFLAPDGRPFFAGTYFPRETRGQMLGFVELCGRIAEVWSTRREDLETQADQLVASIGQVARLEGGQAPPGPEVMDQARQAFAETFDGTWGGFGTAPKFPHALAIDHLLADHLATGDAESLRMAVTSLDAMAAGGIMDHLGGGFARYSVDQRWLVPHFEKMLYDQALLGRAYLHAWQVTGDERHRRVLSSIVGYVLDELATPGGGFASAEDADSEGVEGRFYVWSLEEITSVLRAGGMDDAAIAEAVAWWGVTEGGNFEGANILYRPDRSGDAPSATVEDARRILHAHRATRVRPGLDDKVLTEWNGYFLATLAEAAAATGDEDWLAAAVRCGEFLIDQLLGDDGRWLRSWQAEGGARHLAYAGDHAALVDAFTRLAEATGEARWIVAAQATADALLELFWDHERGGVFTTGSDAEALVARPKDLMDNAGPSANGLAATALLRLGALTGEERYRDRAGDILSLLEPLVGRHPMAFAQLLAAVRLWNGPVTEVVVSGEAPELVAAVHGRFRPGTVLAWGEPYDSPLWEGRHPDAAGVDGPAGEAKAYVCRSYACQLPVTTPAELASQLGDA